MKNYQKHYALLVTAMRITFFQALLTFLFAGVCLAHNGGAQSLVKQTMTFQVQEQSVKKVLSIIEQEANVKFVFSSKLISADRKVSINVIDQSLAEVLNNLLLPLDLDYEISGKVIILKRKVKAASTQNILDVRVSGRVTDAATKQPLPGVNIILKGAAQGTATDADGRYSITVPDGNSVLVFSYIGFAAQEITVGNRTLIDVGLSPDLKSLGEVIVVGYTTQAKRDVVGAVGSISAKEITQVPIISADQALQGRVSGVQVQQTSGAPGGAVQVRIRGVASTRGGGGNQPLYVVDGIPLSWNETAQSLSVGNEGSSGGAGSNGSSPLAGINPNDIESMQVLKDVASTAIYGARAANGVVIITTKTGKAGSTRINFDAYYGIQNLRKKIPMINARERMATVFEWRRNAGTRGSEAWDVWAVNPYLYNYDGTDWQDEIFQTAPMQNYSLSASGGTDKITFSVSGDYLDQEGIVLSTYAKRFSTRANLDIKATDRLKFGTRTALSYTADNRINTDEFFQSQLAYPGAPGSPVRDALGRFTGRINPVIAGGLGHSGGSNVIANMLEQERRSDRYRIISSLFAELEVAKGLSVKSMFAVDYVFTELRSRNPIWARGIDVNANQTLFQSTPRAYNYLGEQTLNYRRTFGDHNINAVLGFSAQQFRESNFSVSAEGSNSNALDQLGNMVRYTGTPNGGKSVNALVSQFMQVNYGFKDRYLVTANLRRDGSSRFGGNNKYGYFPSAGLAWRVSEEPFLKNLVTIPELKFRTSYGSVGNQNIADFLYLPLVGGAGTVWGNNAAPGLAPNRFENRDIKWENNTAFDIGIDLSILNNRLNFTADYYERRSLGLLGGAPLSITSGVGNSYITNLGTISNKGIEFEVNGVIINRDKLRWAANFNIATNQNRVDKLGVPFINGAAIDRVGNYINRTEPGHPIGGYYVIQERGQYQTWEEAATAPIYRVGSSAQPYFAPGDFKPVDQNGDGIINDEDRVWVGSPFPDYFGGLGTNVNYKGFSLDVVGSFQVGNLLWNQTRLNSETFENNVWRVHYDNRWKPSEPGVVTKVPVPRNNNPLLVSDRFLEDASFLRVRTITLGYELPTNLLSKAHVRRARVYVAANNYLTFTKYSGLDPEVNSFGSSVVTNGVDIGGYPIAKSLMLGINLGL